MRRFAPKRTHAPQYDTIGDNIEAGMQSNRGLGSPNVWCTARTGVKNRVVLLNPLTCSDLLHFLERSPKTTLCFVWAAMITVDEGHGAPDPAISARSPLDASSSPSGLRIVDLIAMSDCGDVAQSRAEHRVHDTAARIAARMTAGWPRRQTPDHAPALSNHSPL